MAETQGAGQGAGARYVKTIQPVGVLSCHIVRLQCYMLQSDPIFSADDPASAPAARARPRPGGGLQAGRGPQAQTTGTHQDEDKRQRRGAGEIFF